jgi:predicted RND superfamily exporter protein
MANPLELYGNFVGRRPFLVLSICIVIFIVGNIGSGLVRQDVIDFSEQVPDDIETIQAFDFIEDEFGGTGFNVIYVVETDPDYPGSGEIRDVRDPAIMTYLDVLGSKAGTIEQVDSVRSAADLLRESNGGKIPRSSERIREIIDAAGNGPSVPNPFDSYISTDYSIAAVRINYNAVDDFESEEIVNELLDIGAETPPPGGTTVKLTGGPVTSVVLLKQVGPTFAITGILSFVGIFVVVVLIFYSLRYGITSLLAVVFGSTWAFGFLGFTGFALNPNTSGALSLILGIGIDFGIQVVSRFRQELRRAQARRAIARTMPNVIAPMTISVAAIILGFKALSLGNLQFVGELGDIMALGVFMSYLAAITVIPATLVILNTFSLKRLRGGNSV